MDFTELDLNKKLLKGIKAAGFIRCTPVQEATFAQTLKKRDVCVQSQTGTGKTGAFLISIFQLLLENEYKDTKKSIIIAPTRELAVQIEKEAKIIGKYLQYSIGCFYGGVGYTEQDAILDKGVDIIIGTPGRLIDFGEQGKIDYMKTGFLIIDEADRLFDMGFLPDLQRLINDMPPASERITMLFSATLNSRVRDLAWKYMNDPAEIEISPETIVVDKITQELYHVGKDEKIKLLLGIFKKEQPQNALIFTNMKRTAHEVCRRLEFNGIKCQYIMGDLPQSKRLRIIEKVKSGKIKFLVATEVAARGLHIDDLDLVINYDLPQDCENYVHRIGRTARAGKSGKAISLACEKYIYSLEAIEAFTKYKIPVVKADDEMYLEDKSEGIHFSFKKDLSEVASNQPHKASGPTHVKKPGAVRESSLRKRLLANRRSTARESRKNWDNLLNEKNSPVDFIEDQKNKAFDTTANHSQIKRKRLFGRLISLLRFRSNKRSSDFNQKPKIKASKKGTVQERMEYYKRKYGANFTPSPELLAQEKTKKRKK